MRRIFRNNKKKKSATIGPFMIYVPDGDDFKRGEHWAEEKCFNIISIDPGRTNFALRIERRHKDDNNRIETLEMINKDIRDNSKEGMNVEYNNINTLLDSFNKYYNDIHIVVIEHQVSRLNPDTPRIVQHVISYYLTALKGKRTKPLIFELDPQVKGDKLGYVKKEADKGLKAWSLAKARELLTLRGDEKGLKLLNSKGKKDDKADTICQAEALCKILELPLTKAVLKKKIIINIKKK